MKDYSLFVAAAAWCLGLFPILHYLLFGYHQRKREIMGAFDSDTVSLYFKRYCRDESDELNKEPIPNLQHLYDRRFGRITFIFPVAVYAFSLALVVLVVVASGFETLESSRLAAFRVPDQVAYALAGAYLWVVSDLLDRYRRRDLVSWSLYDGTFRLIIAVPVAYSIVWIVDATGEGDTTAAAANATAFTLGVFPTNTLLLIMRRWIAQRVGLGYDSDTRKYELEALQGINTAVAERFADIGITTFHQLAYEDPIQLTMRMNLPFRVTLDLMSQAILALYVENSNATSGARSNVERAEPEKTEPSNTEHADATKAETANEAAASNTAASNLSIYRRYLIRSALDALYLHRDLHSEKDDVQKCAKAVLNALAKDLKLTPQVLENILSGIADDPATIFLAEMPI